MGGRSDAAETKGDEDKGSERPKLGPSEKVKGGDNDGHDAQGDDDREVNDEQPPITVKAIVQPGNEGADGEKSNAAIIKPEMSSLSNDDCF